jgi:hypothetical protein
VTALQGTAESLDGESGMNDTFGDRFLERLEIFDKTFVSEDIWRIQFQVFTVDLSSKYSKWRLPPYKHQISSMPTDWWQSLLVEDQVQLASSIESEHFHANCTQELV